MNSTKNSSWAIEVTDFVKRYDNTLAAAGISFRLPRGVVGALVGPNGAGKTTTLRTLCGILRPTSGCLRVGGFDVERQPLQVKQIVAYVPDDPPLFETLTVWEHIEFVAAAYRMSNFCAQAEELLKQFRLEDKRDELTAGLSRGMRQKLAIVCAYLHRPEVMLFDEPLTGLDPMAIRMLKQSMTEQARQGATVLVSSHLLALVEDICQYLIVLQQGRCLFSGTRQEAQQRCPNATNLEEVFFRITESSSTEH